MSDTINCAYFVGVTECILQRHVIRESMRSEPMNPRTESR
jgi:hypothetical protein